MKSPVDNDTQDMFGVKKKPGPKPSGNALSGKERQRRYREAQAARIAELEARLRAAEGQIAFIQRIDRYEDR